MSRLRQWLAAVTFVFVAGGGLLTIATPAQAGAACARFITIPAWHCGLVDASGNMTKTDPKEVVLTVVANIVEIVLQVVGYVSLGFIIYGGFLYMISTGDAGKLAGAKSTILNAVIGLIVAIFSVSVINFLTERF